jgi:hypothetical protein
MKVFWWQGGLHAEPETSEERKAMALLLGSAQLTSIANADDSGPSASVLLDHGAKLLGCNAELEPSASGSIVEKFTDK